jgi:bacterioferritin
MKADPKVIEYLNTVLTNELTAINQYFLHARMLDHWGVTKLGKHEYQESLEEMRHADSLIKRVLFLDALPNLQRLNPLIIGQSPEAIPYCESVRDFVSRDLFSGILRDEEDHIDFIETQFDLIKRIGVQNWMQLNSGASDSD